MVVPLPTLMPFTFHWNAGDEPPPVAVAVKVITRSPQIVSPGLADMAIAGTTVGITVI